MQSVKPPVEAPMSMQIFPSSLKPHVSMAFSSLSPPLLTYLGVAPLTSIFDFEVSKKLPALSSFCPLTYTIPDIMIAFAFSLEGAYPSCTSITSSLSFMFYHNTLSIFSVTESASIPAFSLSMRQSPCSMNSSGRLIIRHFVPIPG